mmetsp:Transcript_131716/g.332656  ORF Transcript_131716/g.332656 Transcript_131716/m.332656 type:complete len:219 (-) Transcript_131716:1172-1828(-)
MITSKGTSPPSPAAWAAPSLLPLAAAECSDMISPRSAASASGVIVEASSLRLLASLVAALSIEPSCFSPKSCSISGCASEAALSEQRRRRRMSQIVASPAVSKMAAAEARQIGRTKEVLLLAGCSSLLSLRRTTIGTACPELSTDTAQPTLLPPTALHKRLETAESAFTSSCSTAATASDAVAARPLSTKPAAGGRTNASAMTEPARRLATVRRVAST